MAVFFYDLLRSTRRGRVALLRSVYALVLFLALYSLYARWFPQGVPATGRVSASEMARFAEEFFARFLFIQTCAVVLLTPGFTAGAIAEERQRGTLDCLLTTHLTPITIVYGKFAARLTQLIGVLLTGLPVLAFLPLWGGVDPWKVVGAFAMTATTMMCLGALGLWCSASARTVRGAVTGAYALATVLCSCPACVCVSPFGPLVAVMGQDPLLDLMGFASMGAVEVCQILMALMVLLAAERDLRLSSGPSPTDAPPIPIAPSFSSPEPSWQPRLSYWRPRVGERPLLWKELYIGGSELINILLPLLIAILGLGLGLCLMFALAGWMSGNGEVREQISFILRAFAVMLLAIVALVTFSQATASVGREREQKTLDMLLTLPEGRDGLLETKWLGSILCGRWLLLGLLAVLGLGIIGGGAHPLALLLLPIVAGTHLAFISSLGVYLSVTITGTGRASLIGIVILFVVCVWPLVVYPTATASIPPVAWVLCLPRTFDATQWLRDPNVAMALPLGVVAYAALAGVFWVMAVHRFHRESDRAAVVT